jgi:hypothetical protein
MAMATLDGAIQKVMPWNMAPVVNAGHYQAWSAWMRMGFLLSSLFSGNPII